MDSAGGLIVYVMLWMVVFLAALPIGVRRAERPEPGHDAGAPENPQLWRKAASATIIAAALWAVAYWVIESGRFSLRLALI